VLGEVLVCGEVESTPLPTTHIMMTNVGTDQSRPVYICICICVCVCVEYILGIYVLYIYV